MTNNDQNEFGLPLPNNNKRNTSDLLPRFFRTTANKKFLQSTLDQLTQPGVAEKINGYFGRKTAKSFKPSDNYIGDVSPVRENYQFEPAGVIKDNLDNVTFYKDYNDYMNQLEIFGSNTENHSRVNSQETYAWNPNIDWDKFVNFREYYWQPTGPVTVPVRGQSQSVVSTYTVTTVEEDDNVAYIFNDGFERNPTLKLYRGQTYRFEIDTPGHPIAFAITRSFTPGTAVVTAGTQGVRGPALFDSKLYGNDYDTGDFIVLPSGGSVEFEDDENVSTIYPDGIVKLGNEGDEIANVYVEKGTIKFTIPLNAPERLYYISKNSVDTSGLLRIADIEENTFLNVGEDILGKKTYTSANGVEFTNGLKIIFQGNITPNIYEEGAWYVEGVGDKIVLIREEDLTIPAAYSKNQPVPYDTEAFDRLPFSNASAFAAEKDYILVNRASRDRNAWTRYNRWFHRSVIEKSFEYNDLPVDIDESTRARRPIIEFEAGLKLFNFGTEAKQDVDLVDTFTKDVFSDIEGQLGYNVDGIDLAQDMRILFAADTDQRVNGKIYRVNFITIGNSRQISLLETEDSTPQENETVFVTQGVKFAGKSFSYNGTEWIQGQEKTKINQAPRFDLCCPQGNFYGNQSVFDSSTFTGTEIFSYKQGEGVDDEELGFPLTYRSINNSGDIVFEFNLLSDSFEIQDEEESIKVETKNGNLRKYKTRTDFEYVNGWSSTPAQSKQRVIRQYAASRRQRNNFAIDVYRNSGDLNDLSVVVVLNNKLQKRFRDYEIDRINKTAFVRFYNDLNVDDVVIIKTHSNTVKNSNGYYEFPLNLEHNPLNENPTEFTLGEVIDHVDGMVEEIQSSFEGVFPGNSNLRDLGELDQFGKRFVKHSGPITLPLYHVTNKEYNIVRALEYSKKEYSRFKRIFVQTAIELGYDGPVKQHVDKVLGEINQDKVKTQPFYFSDMLGRGSANRIEYQVLDSNNKFFPISQEFGLNELSSRAVNVYLNGVQILYNRDYIFRDNEYVEITKPVKENDLVEIYEYESTDGSFIPPTPTKLGLYPGYEPELSLDDTYITDSITSVTIDNPLYDTTSVRGNSFRFTVSVALGIANYEVTVIEGGVGFEEGDTVTVNGNSLNGTAPANNLTITVTSVNSSGAILDVTVEGNAPTLSPVGPYKIYGESESGIRGWFWPVYLAKKAAEEADSNSSAELIRFKGLNKLFYVPANSGESGGNDNDLYEEYPEAIPMIRGHDGSYVKAYKDYRDNLLLDLETRIFNNIKVAYNTDIFDINDFVPGKFRNTGFTRQEVNSSLLKDFIQWSNLIDNDYTENSIFTKSNQFTYNHSGMTSAVDGASLPGFWRAAYKEAFDTDRPHTHPWEMLGFSIKPQWWDTVYGPAPYTRNNLILWQDLEEGIVREPNKNIKIRSKYTRPGLQNFIPVDSQGQLKSPVSANYAKGLFFRDLPKDFVFGDEAPVETAWRRSSEYAFAVLKAWLLNQPAKVMGVGFDISRITRNLSGQYVYKDTLQHITLNDLVFPNTYQDSDRQLTSGLVNYVYNLLASNILTTYETYKSNVRNLNCQLGIKIAGFTDKQKFKLLLDSRSPRETFVGGIFVPEENYQIFLNTSSPIDRPVYSGVIIEKKPSGFAVRGYNEEDPFFTYFPVIETKNDFDIVIGGIAEASVDWAENKRYIKDQVVEFGNAFYRATDNFTSGTEFDTENLAILPELPIVGGRRAKVRKNFDNRRPKKIAYGSLFKTVQEVVDFLLGYEAYLVDQGFEFENYNNETDRVENWNTASREFLFWTTQKWAEGTTITLSPSAQELSFQRDFAVVDDIFDEFYGYTLYKADGLPLERKFSNVLREDNSFGLNSKNTDEGIYNLKLPLVQKEHVVLLDNKTVFSDIIYQPSTGYKQERIKVLGYRSDDWTGSLNIPGFIYDDAEITDWQPWKDYQVGTLVRHKEFFYVAIESTSGKEEFDFNQWYRLNEKPESKLSTNFDYKINQFTDFYDLDTDGFDSEQQQLAQHLIGYQKREYLANIINDDVSQYKFYQGFIQDKGTRNAIDKLFGKLSSAGKESFEYHEEWALQVGSYGAVDDVQQVEYIMKEESFQDSPQAVELVNTLPTGDFDKVFRILPFEAYDKSEDYDHKPFPTTNLKEYILSGGYVHEDDVEYKTSDLFSLQQADINQISLGEYIWVTQDLSDSWAVYQLDDAVANVKDFSDTGEINNQNQRIFTLTINKWAERLVSPGDIVGVKRAGQFQVTGMYKVTDVDFDKITIVISTDLTVNEFNNEDGAVYPLVKLRKVRVDNLTEFNSLVENKTYQNQRVWVDNDGNGDWAVLENSKVYDLARQLNNPDSFDSTDHEFTKSMSVTDNNRTLFVSAPGSDDGIVYYYNRSKETDEWVLEPAILPPESLFDVDSSRFGESISVSEDGKYLAVGIPRASSIKTRFKGEFDPDKTYNKNDIVKFRETLWKAIRQILPATNNQDFSTFDSYYQLIKRSDDSSALQLIYTGHPGIENNTVQNTGDLDNSKGHILVKAPVDMFLGSAVGDTVALNWNETTFLNAVPNEITDLETVEPFNGVIPEITDNFITGEHEILEKVEAIFLVDPFVLLPAVGDTVENNTGTATVRYVYSDVDQAVIYVNNIKGVFNLNDELFRIDPLINEREFIGFYTQEQTIIANDLFGGYWLIESPVYNNGTEFVEEGKGLVYRDLVTEDQQSLVNRPFQYYNIQETINQIGVYLSNNLRSSFITQLSYFGDPADSDETSGVPESQPSKLWVVRAPQEYTDNVTVGDTFRFELFEYDDKVVDFTDTGLNYNKVNGQHTIADLWDGYIDFEFTRFDFSGFPFQPQVGDILEDVQTPFNDEGGLALTSITTSSARVEYIQRDFNDVRVYVKVVPNRDGTVGNWTLLNNIARVELRRRANEDIRDLGDVDRIVGTVNDFRNDVVLANTPIGKLVVVENSDDFPEIGSSWQDVVPVIDEEYWFYKELFDEQGTARESNPPSSVNKDYEQVFNIPADSFGTEGPQNEGVVAIYRKKVSSYELQTVLTSEFAYNSDGSRKANRQFGNRLELVKDKNLYRLLVTTQGDIQDSSRGNNGSVEIFKHGAEDTETFRGDWNPNESYSRNEIVVYQEQYYQAKILVPANDIEINNTIYWKNISWRHGKDKNYRGEWNNSEGYAIDSIVAKDNELYQAQTNTAAGAEFDTVSWNKISSQIDYLGYLPNLTGNAYLEEDVFDPAEDIVQFADKFAVNKNGSILIIKSVQEVSDSTENTVKILIYRLIDSKYILSQTIDAPNRTDGFADSIAINPAGTVIAIGEPFNDTVKRDAGRVYIYRQQNNQFELSQILESPQREISENFGSSLAYSNDNLVVTSRTGDMILPTTFDVDVEVETTFDRGFTEFRNLKVDTGNVYIYEELNERLIFAESFRYDDATYNFGENLLAKENFVYVGMTDNRARTEDSLFVGNVVEYRKTKNTAAWTVARELKQPVDVARIRGAFLYNKRENRILSYLDYIDPIQGKIAGPAEQEITFKTAYDPARYNVDAANNNENAQVGWQDEYVGKLWWDINSAKFTYPYQGSIQYQKDNWNELQPDSVVTVFEWVESDLLPSQWDSIADTERGLNRKISGRSLYGDDRFSRKYVYDDIAKAYSVKYYFWVVNKRTVPEIENRTLSAFDVAQLIARPREQGYRYISFLGNDRFILNNCESLISDNDVVLNIKYTTTETPKEQNLHRQYQIMSDGLDISVPQIDIERKWFDSLIGVDEQNRPVPAENLTVKQKYGIQNTPRQSMFVNRVEALKQAIERINLVFEENIIVDEFDISDLLMKEPAPTAASRRWDEKISTLAELRFVSTNKVEQAILEPVVVNGEIISVSVVNSGRGYKVAPTLTVRGSGSNAEFETEINNLGQITNVRITNQGKNYTGDTQIFVRRFSVLVEADESAMGKWTVYSWNNSTKQWFRRSIQDYDVSLYWDYVDWYAQGYNNLTAVDFNIEESYELTSLDDKIGNVVKINNVGTGDWLLLEKVNNEMSEDYTVNYKIIGRQNGTIKFNDSLYNFAANSIGYDNATFDNTLFDINPTNELRIILKTLRDKIFVNTLKVEYNKLFFSSLRYILSEQLYVDWMFKTSFIKIKHNLGELDQDITFDNDTLPSYEAYVKEVKPYKTVIREFVSAYETLEPTNTAITDFDTAPAYSVVDGKILPTRSKVIDNTVTNLRPIDTEYPRKFWSDNLGYSVTEIALGSGGRGYTYKPTVKLEGGGGVGATAEAFLGYGAITKIKITNPGSGYITAPRVIIEGPQTENGVPAVATAVLGQGLIRTPSIKIRFDRISGEYYISQLEETETFTGTGADTDFDLKWPMDLRSQTVSITVDGEEKLRSEYSFENADYPAETSVTDAEFNYGGENVAAGPGSQKIKNSYTHQRGRIKFTTPPEKDSEITINYAKPLSMLNAEDRINFAYNPTTGQLGKDLSQLMTGVDYAGVEIQSIDFGEEQGWDTQGWFTDNWDNFEDVTEDFIFNFDGSTIAIDLEEPLENNAVYNVYYRPSGTAVGNEIRLDDPNYDTPQQNNPNAIMKSLTGDGETETIELDELGITVVDGDTLIIRKTSSDGSFNPAPDRYDTALTGGDLDYANASGINAEDINVDGDGFVTPTTSAGPEELVPGQVADTLDIKVYTRETAGQGIVYSQSYITTETQAEFDLGVLPSNKSAVFVKLDNVVLDDSEYTIDWVDKKVTIDNMPVGVELTIVTVEGAVQNIVDYGSIVSTGDLTDFVTDVRYQENLTVHVTVNGETKTVDIIKDETSDLAVIRFEEPLEDNQLISYVFFDNSDEVNYSQISKETFAIDSENTASIELSQAPFYQKPTAYNTLVKVNNRVLNPGYNIQYTIPENRQREYSLEEFQQPGNALESENLRVFVNGEEIVSPTQWRFEIITSQIILSQEIGEPGDVVEIFVTTDGEYTINSKTVNFTPNLEIGDTVEVYKFSNHNLLDIERINYDVVDRANLIAEDLDYITYNRLTVGEVTLRKPAAGAEYVWVSVNGELLTPNVDYSVNDEGTKLQLLRTPDENDVIDILHFTAPVRVRKFAFRQFKDILNRTHYKRLDQAITVLAKPLAYDDLRIEVEDATDLPEPNKGKNLPGIIFVNGERIEYFVKENNLLRQLRRGTLGTGVKELHEQGSEVFDQNADKTVPYQDVTQTQIETADGNTDQFVLKFTASSINEFEVFVAGKRLRKTSIDEFDPVLALDSPQGDVTVPAEFTFNSETNSVTLTETPLDEQTVVFSRKIGKSWTELGKTLAETQTDIGYFLRAGTTDLPK
jgi:hypothetical protein